MKKFLLICLCNAILLVALCLPVEARITLGMTPVAPLSGQSQATLDRLGVELKNSVGTAVTIRRFDNDAALSNWLLRFQELDAAVVASGFIKQQPAGALRHLADLHSKNSAASPLALVARRNLNKRQATEIKDAFLKLGTSDSGRKILREMGLAGVTAPGEALKRKAAQQAPLPVKPVQKKVAAPAKIKPVPAPQPLKKVVASPKKSQKKQPAPTVTKKQPSREKIVVPETPPKIAAVKTADKPVIETPDKQASKPKAAAKPVVQEPAKPETKPKAQAQAVSIAGEPAKQTEPKEQLESTLPQKEPTATGEAPQEKPAVNKRLTMFIALIILVAILIKTCLFALRWQNKKKSTSKQGIAPDIGSVLDGEVAAAPTAEKTPADEELIIEAGQLGPGKVPALLKRCADLPKPVVLQVTKGSCEKLVYFVGGQVSGALTQNTTTTEPGMRWHKLGNLMLREGLISKEEHDQGIALLTKEPGLRFGEALLKLGLIDLAKLRHALTRQAKATIYSLMLFHEGRYQIFAGEGSLPPEESVSLEISSLIREASHHQSEWTAIRKALPRLNTALDFCQEGRSKLEKVNISAQQEEALSLIDGKRTINDLCIESAMTDYEVYRFLYLMVNAGVLKQQLSL